MWIYKITPAPSMKIVSSCLDMWIVYKIKFNASFIRLNLFYLFICLVSVEQYVLSRVDKDINIRAMLIEGIEALHQREYLDQANT